jgi:tryptophan synthase beta chain
VVRGAMDEAIRCREEGKSETIVFNLCGRGRFGMSAYNCHLRGDIVDYKLSMAARHQLR